MIRRFSRFCERNPLVAVWLGFAVCFVLMYCAAPLLVRHVEHVARSAT
jgi:hypothetical protein